MLLENYSKISELKNNYMEEVENNIFRKKAKVKPNKWTFIHSKRIHPKIWNAIKIALAIVISIFILPIVIEDTKSSDGYFQFCFALVSSVLATILNNAMEIADTPLSSLTIGKLIGLIVLYKSFCRVFFSYEKNTPD